MTYIDEKYLINYPKPIFVKEAEEILKQMKYSVCKISKKDGSKGTGFFCKIPLSSNKYFSILITNNHVINEQYLKKEKEISIK